MGKTDLTWENLFNLLPIKSEQSNEKQNLNLRTPSSHPSLLPRLILTPNFLYLLLPSGAGGQGMGFAISSSHNVSVAPSFSHSSPAPMWGPSHRRQSAMNFSNVAPSHRLAVLHKLLQCGSLPWGAVLQEQAAPARVPHGVTSPASNPAPVWAPLSMGPQVLPGACSSTGSPWGRSFLGASTCCSVDLLGLQGHRLPHHGLLQGLQGNLCSSTWSTSFPLLLHWPWCLQISHSCLWLQMPLHSFFSLS